MKRLLAGASFSLAATLALPGCSAQDAGTPALAPVSARPQQVYTPRGSISVPGPAFLDGRDVDSNPPVTLMTINVWSVLPGGQIVCQLSHGESVHVLSRKLGPRLFLEIEGRGEHDGCSGWVAAVFVGPEAVEPVGKRM